MAFGGEWLVLRGWEGGPTIPQATGPASDPRAVRSVRPGPESQTMFLDTRQYGTTWRDIMLLNLF